MKRLLLCATLAGCGGSPAEYGRAATAAATGAETGSEEAPASAAIAEQRRTMEAARPVEGVARWRRETEARTWQEARDLAPAGCRVPARWELVKGFDDGEFERINTWAWTASEIDAEHAWLVLQSNLVPGAPEHRSNMIHKLTKNYVIYLCEAP